MKKLYYKHLLLPIKQIMYTFIEFNLQVIEAKIAFHDSFVRGMVIVLLLSFLDFMSLSRKTLLEFVMYSTSLDILAAKITPKILSYTYCTVLAIM